MYRSLCVFVIILSFLAQYLSLSGQDYKVYRYKIIPNALLNLKEESPEKSNKISKEIESLPKYLDFLFVDSNMVMISWLNDSSIFSIEVFNRNENHYYRFFTGNKLFEEKISDVPDTINIYRISTQDDSLLEYELEIKNEFPISITLNKSLDNDSILLFYKTKYSFIGIVLADFGEMPLKFVFGKPKVFITLELINDENIRHIVTKNDCLHLVENVEFERNRQEFIDKLSLKTLNSE